VTVFLEKYIIPILVGLFVIVLAANPMHFSWLQRGASLLASLVLGGFVSWNLTRRNKKKASEIKTEMKEERIFVSVAPEDLMKIHKGHTEIQANKLTASYIGKWIKVSGTVQNVSKSLDNQKVYVSLDDEGSSIFDYFFEQMAFSSDQWLERLEIIPRGHHMTVIGQIDGIDSHRLSLVNCELIDVA